MKILMVSNIFPPYIIGGYELGAMQIALGLKARGHQIIVATSINDPRFVKKSFDIKELRGLDVRHVLQPMYAWQSMHDVYWGRNAAYLHDRANAGGGYVEANVYALKHLIDTEDPEVIYLANPIGIGPIGLMELACAYKGKRVVLHLMDRVDTMIMDGARALSLGAKWKQVKAKVHAIACSRMIAEQNQGQAGAGRTQMIEKWIAALKAQRHPGTKQKPVAQIVKIEDNFASMQVIYNGVQTKQWLAKAQKYKSGPLKIAYWGRIVPEKGISYMLEIASHMKAHSRQPIQIDLYGSGPEGYISFIKKEITRRGIEKSFRLMGYVGQRELKKKLESYQVGMFLVWANEPFCYVVPESVLCGLTTIAPSDIPNVREVLGPSSLAVAQRGDYGHMQRILERIAAGDKEIEKERQAQLKKTVEQLDMPSVLIPQIERALKKAKPNRGYDIEIPLAHARQMARPMTYDGGMAQIFEARKLSEGRAQIKYPPIRPEEYAKAQTTKK